MRAKDTTRPGLEHQSLGRKLSDAEQTLSRELMDIMGAPQHDYAQVAAELSQRGVVAPVSGRTDWDEKLLAEELGALNADLDKSYTEDGYGA